MVAVVCGRYRWQVSEVVTMMRRWKKLTAKIMVGKTRRNTGEKYRKKNEKKRKEKKRGRENGKGQGK